MHYASTFAMSLPKPFFLVLLFLLSPAAASPLLSASSISNLRSALDEVQKVSSLLPLAASLMEASDASLTLSYAIQDCIDLLEDTSDELLWVLAAAENRPLDDAPTTRDTLFDVHSWLTAAHGNQETCKEGLREAAASNGGHGIDPAAYGINSATSLIAGCLHEVASSSLSRSGAPPAASSPGTKAARAGGRKLLGFFPEWFLAADRRILVEETAVPDVVVAQDGSGDYATIAEAVAAAPVKKMNRFVIYVKEGRYIENVEVGKKAWNVMLVGDGMNRTIISGNHSVATGWTTFRSATLAVRGRGFIAKHLAIENTAGPKGSQAVALRSGSDLSVFYRCNISGYQDTLYAHSLRQFYRECQVTGTVDFIFGQAAAVFQKCDILPRNPSPGKMDTITAQARISPDQYSGFSFQFCNVTATSDLAGNNGTVSTYLGRPWRPYSRVVFMESYIGSVVRPEGWLEWQGRNPSDLSKLYYGEFNNTGPGSPVDHRVNWKGYHVISDRETAAQFTVDEFIEGKYWLPATGVNFTAGL